MPNKGKKSVASAAKQAAVAAVKAVEKQHAKKQKSKPVPKNPTVKKSEVKKVVDKEVAKKLRKIDGPKSQYQVSVSATLGYVTGNDSHGPNLKLTSFLHPALCKSPDESTNFGPLQAAAAQYGLWRVSRAHISLTPLVGPSAISGTIIRGSVNLSQSPSSTGWGGLGARKHLDLQAGVRGFFKLSRRDLAGPRDGGWWVTDTNVEGQQSAGPVFEIHALGESTSTYQNTEFKREIYIVEMKATWQFCNYVSNPALGTLERKEAETKVSFATTEQKEIVMNVEAAPEVLRFLDDPTIERASGDQPSKPGEVIWQLADTAAEAVSGLMPPPFGWLARGGWWFIKKIAGRASYGFRSAQSATFLVYPSLADAQNNRPAVAASVRNAVEPVPATLQFTQMNAPNMGGTPPTAALVSASTFPVYPDFPPTSGYAIFKSILRPTYYREGYKTMPHVFVGNFLTWQGKTYRACLMEARDSVALTIPGSENEITRFGVPQDGPTGVISFSEPIENGTLNPIVLADMHVQVGSGCWLHAFFFKSQTSQNNLKWKQEYNKNLGYLITEINSTSMRVKADGISPSDTDKVIFNFESTTADPKEREVGNKHYLAICLSVSQNGGNEINWGGGTFGVTTQTPIPNLYGMLLLHQYYEGFKTWYEMKIKEVRRSRVEKLAERLGLTLADFESDSDGDYETDVEDDEDETQSGTSEFDVIPQPGGASDYMMLREQGLSHQEALDVIAAKNPAV
uniref:Capsid protein n=1 Tax=Miniopterus bat astrovirus TaxID=3141885 RepID=A0AAU7E338_9VIRU